MGTTKRWSYKAGEKGRNRVRAYERPDGRIFLEFYELEPASGEQRRKRVACRHRDRDRAKVQADKLAAKFAAGEQSGPSTAPLSLRTLFDRWKRERGQDVRERERGQHERCAEMFVRCLGDRAAMSLRRTDWDRYCRLRRSGAIDARGNAVPEKERKPVGPRTVQHDLSLLRAALNWAVSEDLLETNPTDRYPLPRVSEPARPRVSRERYAAMREAAPSVGWRFDVALVLAYETGHRIGAIRHLRWSDVNLANRTVRWRAEHDKRRRAHVTPLSGAAVKALRKAQRHSSAIGEAAVLPKKSDDSSRPCTRDMMRRWWNRCETLAGLDHVPNLGWHGLRRTFADEVRGAPRTVAAKLGGWAGPEVMESVYQDASLDAMREVQRKRRGG